MADVQTSPTVEDLLGIIGMLVSGKSMSDVTAEQLPEFDPAGRIFTEACFTGWQHRRMMASLRQMQQQAQSGLRVVANEPPAEDPPAATPVVLGPRPTAPQDAAMADTGGVSSVS